MATPNTIITSEGVLGTGEKLWVKSGGQLVTDRFGMSSAACIWGYCGPNPEGQVSIFDSHPRWDFLEMDKRTITRNDDGSWEIVGSFFGIQGSDPDPIYALDTSTSQEPLPTNSKFIDFAGTDAAPLNGAVFDEDGLFVGFRPVGSPVSNKKWLGVEAYNSYSAVWRETYVTKTKPGADDVVNLESIDSPPGSPPTPSGRNWLYATIGFEQKAKTYTVRREWLLSGKNGWNSEIYGT